VNGFLAVPQLEPVDPASGQDPDHHVAALVSDGDQSTHRTARHDEEQQCADGCGRHHLRGQSGGHHGRHEDMLDVIPDGVITPAVPNRKLSTTVRVRPQLGGTPGDVLTATRSIAS
jgi:hypothetical protein